MCPKYLIGGNSFMIYSFNTDHPLYKRLLSEEFIYRAKVNETIYVPTSIADVLDGKALAVYLGHNVIFGRLLLTETNPMYIVAEIIDGLYTDIAVYNDIESIFCDNCDDIIPITLVPSFCPILVDVGKILISNTSSYHMFTETCMRREREEIAIKVYDDLIMGDLPDTVYIANVEDSAQIKNFIAYYFMYNNDPNMVRDAIIALQTIDNYIQLERKKLLKVLEDE